MGRSDLEKARAEQAAEARKWHRKETERVRGKDEGILIKLSRLVSRATRSVGYKRHQGDREKARRVSQISRGIISPDQVLTA